MVARTIDNLGLETSTRYAEDQALYDQVAAQIKESGFISTQTKITATIPSYKSEFEQLMGIEKKRAPWALFEAPPRYAATRRSFFSELLIPRLGSPDLQEAKVSRLELLGQEGTQSPAATQERQVLTALLNKVHYLDTLLIDTNSKRAQYQKG